MKNKWALITGASSGIGRELAYLHAQRGGNLVLVARTEKLLNEMQIELTAKFQIEVLCLALDLSVEGSIAAIGDALKKKEIELSVLMNNAGFGGYGLFAERDIHKDLNMIDLNVRALTHLTHSCLPFFATNGSSYILNIASVAAFFPGPWQATYFATKAYVLSFSHALATELKASNISVTAICPGPVHTNFEKSAQINNPEFFKNALSAKKTAERAYRAMLNRRREFISDYSMALPLRLVLPLLPRRLRSALIYHVQKPK